MPVIEIQNLKKYFGATKAVDGISFDIDQGEIFGFLGPNGAGKSTTIRCMLDLIRADSGKINILGKDSHQDSVELKRQIGYLPGGIRLKDKWNGQDYIDFVLELRKCTDNSEELIKYLNFDPTVKTRYLSLGNRQKLGLILAFIGQPKVLLLDEPTLGLDPLLQNSAYNLMTQANSRGATIFMSSHNLADVERICDRVGIIKNGQMMAVEAVKDMKQKKLYKIMVRFKQNVDKKIFDHKDIQVRDFSQDYWKLDVRGDINLVVDLLSKYELKDLQIEHASLKAIFMEFYKE